MSNRCGVKQLIVLGGPNGAGKSSAYTRLELLGFVTGSYLNPDDIAQGLGGDPATRDIPAGRETLRLAKLWIDERRTFTRESTLTSNEVLRWMRDARDVGYRVVLVSLASTACRRAKRALKTVCCTAATASMCPLRSDASQDHSRTPAAPLPLPTPSTS